LLPGRPAVVVESGRRSAGFLEILVEGGGVLAVDGRNAK
jgi:hypothetical protein